MSCWIDYRDERAEFYKLARFRGYRFVQYWEISRVARTSARQSILEAILLRACSNLGFFWFSFPRANPGSSIPVLSRSWGRSIKTWMFDRSVASADLRRQLAALSCWSPRSSRAIITRYHRFHCRVFYGFWFVLIPRPNRRLFRGLLYLSLSRVHWFLERLTKIDSYIHRYAARVLHRSDYRNFVLLERRFQAARSSSDLTRACNHSKIYKADNLERIASTSR